MILRFIYHGFWNFYDHMGTLILWGTVHALLSLGLAVLTVSAIADPVAALPIFGIVAVLEFTLLVLALAALLPYCARAARGEPARVRHLIEGIKTKGAVVARILFVLVAVIIVLSVNLSFYLPLQGEFDSPAFKLLLVFIVAVIGWTCLFLYIFLPPWLCAATVGPGKVTALSALKKGLMAVALTPGTWMFLAFVGLVLLVGGLYSRVGLVLFIPVMVSLSHTAYQLAAQFADMLTVAKEQVDYNVRLRELKKRAMELAWEWEYAQPKRTFKELIRPWDY
jgi:hypothetical protein